MRCSSCSRDLDRYIEATLTPRRMIDVSAHLRECAACRELLNETKVVDALLFTTRTPELAENFTFAVMAEVNSMPALRPYSHPVWAFVVLYSVAAWVAGVVAMALTRTSPARVAAYVSHVIPRLGTVHFHESSELALFGFGVLLIDAFLAAGIAGFYLFVRPRLAAALASAPEVRP